MEIKYYIENPELIINSEHLTLHDISKFPYEKIENLENEQAKRGDRKKNIVYVNAIGAGDTEQSNIPKDTIEAAIKDAIEEAKKLFLAAPYMFQTGYLIDDTIYFVGIRTYGCFTKHLDTVAAKLGYDKKTGNPRTLMMFVFNLNHDMQIYRGLFHFTNIFYNGDLEHPLSAWSHDNHFEWRDAQALFGPGGLAAATKGLEYEKLKGDLDYSKKRFYWTKIDAKPEYDEKGRRHSEFDYMVNDIAGLLQAVAREKRRNNVSLYGLKKTLTGWTRKDINKILYPMKHKFHHAITKHDSYYIFKNALTKCKRGGNTHASKEFVGDPYSFVCKDVSSMYPDSMIHEKFSVQPFTNKIMWPDNATVEGEVEREENALLMKIRIMNLRLKNQFEPVPYISKDKCGFIVGLGQIKETKKTKKNKNGYTQAPVVGEEDNGRIGYALLIEDVWWNDDDFRIAKSMYDFEYVVEELWTSPYEYLPKEIRDYLIELYKVKVEYSGKPELADERAKAKVRLNSVYGLFCANMMRDKVEYNPETDDYEINIVKDMPDCMQNELYLEACEKTLLVPRIGIWVCSHCRRKLQKLIDIVGPANFLYCDTDSVFYIPDERINAAVDELNEEYKKRAIESGAWGTGLNDDGKLETHYCGCWEDDKDGKIITMGAKKYAYEKNGRVKITIAGVPKASGSEYLESIGGLDAFKPGLKFDCGKLRPIYNRDPDYGTFHLYDCDGVEGDVHVKSHACLVPVSYELDYGKTYGQVIEAVKKGDFSLLHEMLDNTEKDAIVAEALKRRYSLEN